MLFIFLVTCSYILSLTGQKEFGFSEPFLAFFFFFKNASYIFFTFLLPPDF